MSFTDTARRIAIVHAVTTESDRRTHALDPAYIAQNDAERVRELAASLGDVAASTEPHELQDALVAHAALAITWLETNEREAAA